MFERSEFIARMKIDFKTHNYFRDVDPTPEVVKRLVFELIDRGYTSTNGGSEVASMRQGGIAITYATKEGAAEDLIEIFLGPEVDLRVPGQGRISFARAARV